MKEKLMFAFFRVDAEDPYLLWICFHGYWKNYSLNNVDLDVVYKTRDKLIIDYISGIDIDLTNNNPLEMICTRYNEEYFENVEHRWIDIMAEPDMSKDVHEDYLEFIYPWRNSVKVPADMPTGVLK